MLIWYCSVYLVLRSSYETIRQQQSPVYVALLLTSLPEYNVSANSNAVAGLQCNQATGPSKCGNELSGFIICGEFLG
jgi:hypothetical protein